MTDRIEELQRLHEAATQGPWEAMDQGTHRFNCYEVFSGGTSVCNVTCCESGQDERDCELIATMRNALPALLRVARAAKVLRTAMTTPPKGYGDEHQGYWWTAATEKAAEEVAEAVAELEKP